MTLRAATFALIVACAASAPTANTAAQQDQPNQPEDFDMTCSIRSAEETLNKRLARQARRAAMTPEERQERREKRMARRQRLNTSHGENRVAVECEPDDENNY